MLPLLWLVATLVRVQGGLMTIMYTPKLNFGSNLSRLDKSKNQGPAYRFLAIDCYFLGSTLNVMQGHKLLIRYVSAIQSGCHAYGDWR